MAVCQMVVELCATAYGRAVAAGKARAYRDLRLRASAPEIVRSDNESLGRATRDMVEALVRMRESGWIDDDQAARLAFKAAGEVFSEDDRARMGARGVGSAGAHS